MERCFDQDSLGFKRNTEWKESSQKKSEIKINFSWFTNNVYIYEPIRFSLQTNAY